MAMTLVSLLTSKLHAALHGSLLPLLPVDDTLCSRTRQRTLLNMDDQLLNMDLV